MLDMGFIHDVKKILKWLPQKKQTLFFSATMPPEISDLVNSLLKDPVRAVVDPISSPAEAVTQSVYLVDKANKTLLLAHLIRTKQIKSALVFTRTKHGANKVARDLEKAGISAAAIHGNKSQTARQQALSDFKSGKIQCLVATDIAARGLDIEELSHIFNYNLPEVPETYIHRIGRTGRAGRGGEAIAFCDFSEQPLLKDVEKLLGRKVPTVEGHPFPMQVFEAPKRDKHGRIINEEDAEARSAARELRRQREEQKKSAQPAPSVPAPTEAEAPKRSRRRRKKPTQEASAPIPAPAEQKERPRLTRSGSLLHTGNAMPVTEFQRPDPLSSDVIMDATARLLAPRRTAATPAADQGRKKKRSGSSEGRQKQNQPTPSQESASGRKKTGSNHSAQQRAAGQKRPDHRGGGRRGAPPEPRRAGQPKDSTEQPSLMKPYYLDIGR